MIIRALDYYSSKLAKVRAGDELKFALFSLNRDVNLLTAECNDAVKVIRNGGEHIFHDLSKKHCKLILDALNVYTKDLQDAKAKFDENLGANPIMKNIDSDIEFAEEVRQEFRSL